MHVYHRKIAPIDVFVSISLNVESHINPRAIPDAKEMSESIWDDIKSQYLDGEALIICATGRSMALSRMAKDPMAPSPDATRPLYRSTTNITGIHLRHNVEPMEVCLNLLKHVFPISILQILQQWEVSDQGTAAQT